MNELRDIMDFATTIALGAGEITLRYFRQGVAADTKADGSPVTIADREAEAYLRRAIAARYPRDAILGEEEGEQSGASGRRWIIDPIDGTFSFVRGVPFYGVLIGVEIDGEAVVGVVNIPAMSELVCAARGLGCYWNGQRTQASSVANLADGLLLATDFGASERYGFGAAAERLQREAKTRRTWGDCYGHILVATGRAEAMLDPVMSVWDCAPLLPILEEADGTFTDWRGQPTIHGGNAIATNGLIFAEVMEIVTNSN